MKFFNASTIALLLLVSINVFAQKTYILKQNFPVGKKYDFTMVSDQIINQKIGDQNINMTQVIGTDYTFGIRNGNDLEKEIDVFYKHIYLKSLVGDKTGMNMDSDDQDTSKINPFRKLKNASFSMVMLPDGSIKSVTGLEKMIIGMAASTSNNPAIVESLKTSLGKQFSAETLKSTMEASLKIYPDKAIKVGDSWTVNATMKMAMPVETSTKYTLKEVKNGIAYLKIEGSQVSKGNFEMMGNKMETNLVGTNNGDAELNIETGLILNSHIRVELAGTMNSMGQNINFNLQGINKVVGKEVN